MTPDNPAAAAFDATMLLTLQGTPQVPPQVPTDPLGHVDPMSPMTPMSSVGSAASMPPVTPMPPMAGMAGMPPMTEVSQEMHGLEGELARLLQSAAASDAAAAAAASEAAAATAATGAAATGAMGGHGGAAAPYVEPEVATAARRHRKGRHELRWRRRTKDKKAPRSGPPWWLRLANLLLAAAAVSIVSMLSVLGGVISYEPLRGAAATGVSGALAAWWPLLIYGPWLVASLSILRAALHQRRVVHSWVVMILFSGLAVGLCVIGAPREVTDMAVAGLPPVSALIAFHQLVRQISLAHCPRHALPRPRRRI
ncbi:DUF2637 domain-containing protein [Streptomyces sp. B6B3]|uniref:DUF2637 domain-containing protein n=1 Tax=Streptomyces sp. B6B3 TaxID=3153570 RepID=UPI00325E6ABE